MMETTALSPGEVRAVPAVKEPEDEEYQDNFNIHLICPDCRETPPNLVEEFSCGDTVCGSCGLVLSARVVDTRSEWRTFSNDDQNGDDPSRVGDAANPLLHGSQLETNISYADGVNASAKELHRAQIKSAADKSNRSLLAAYARIDTYCEKWQLTSTTKDTAKHMYKLADDSRIFKSKPLENIVAGCIFIACRQNDMGRSFRELHELTSVPKKEIGRIFKSLDRFFNKQDTDGKARITNGMVVPPNQYKVTDATNASELCKRYSNAVGMDRRQSQLAENLAKRMVDGGCLAGRSPLSASAACIFMLSHLLGEPKSFKEIADAVGVSDGTIRAAYKQLYGFRHILLVKDGWAKERGLDVSKLLVL